jgi:hypothetical protein
MNKDRLAVIVAKNPTNILLNTVTNIQLYYDEFDIVIIDSDSDNYDIYDKLPTNCIVEKIKNKNYELGAWVYAFNKYNTYKVYMFIQDSLTPKCRITDLDKTSYENGTIYSFHYNVRLCDGGYMNELQSVYRNTDLHFISELDPNMNITGSAHASFIIDRDHAPIILHLENAYIQKNLTKSKIDAWLSERTCGIMADKLNKRINIQNYFIKHHGNRM